MAEETESVFDEIKESFHLFIERIGELIGFDADQYPSREAPGGWLSLRKSWLLQLGELVVSIYFIFDALQKSTHTSKMAYIVAHALSGRETTMANAGL
jgi:hypothetical protein